MNGSTPLEKGLLSSTAIEIYLRKLLGEVHSDAEYPPDFDPRLKGLVSPNLYRKGVINGDIIGPLFWPGCKHTRLQGHLTTQEQDDIVLGVWITKRLKKFLPISQALHLPVESGLVVNQFCKNIMLGVMYE
ncbi:hypothetical protein FACS1894137_05750 [Spirochaetia bacterium]|nr:hypothetical protein FACS1894137_05750 [Spirochaetia bacterium]